MSESDQTVVIRDRTFKVGAWYRVSGQPGPVQMVSCEDGSVKFRRQDGGRGTCRASWWETLALEEIEDPPR